MSLSTVSRYDLRQWPEWSALCAAAAAGALLVLAFAPYDCWPLALLCPAAQMWLWQGASPRRAALLGLAFGLGTFGAGTWWFYLSIHHYGQVPAPLAILLVAALMALMAAWQCLCGWIAARFLPPTGWARWLLGLPALWLLIEWLRGWVFSGFPWLSLGYSLSDTLLASWAPVGGVYLLSWLLLLAAGALLTLWLGRPAERWAAGALLLLITMAPLGLRHIEWTEAAGPAVAVALAQGAIPQDLKWQAENRAPTRALYARLTREAQGARLIVWPESAIPQLANSMSAYLAENATVAAASGAELAAGVVRLDDNGVDFYNSILVPGRSPQFYDKRHLVPFGEYFPVPDTVRRWMRLMSLPFTDDFTAGRSEQVPLRAAGLNWAPTICYEDAFGEEQRRLAAGADALLNVTNDAWFGRSAARHQHFQVSRMRALESGRQLLRAANDGISAIVGHRGEVIAQAPQFQPALLRGTVQPRHGLTPYLRVGNAPFLWVALVCLAGAVGLDRWFGQRRTDL